MKNILFSIFLYYFTNMGFSQCLPTDSLDLKWNKNRYYRKIDSKKNYSGCVSGWISDRETDLAHVRKITSIICDWFVSAEDSTMRVNYWLGYKLYVIGQLYSGKEVGQWQLFGEDNILVGETVFEDNKMVTITIYYPEGPIKFQKTYTESDFYVKTPYRLRHSSRKWIRNDKKQL